MLDAPPIFSQSFAWLLTRSSLETLVLTGAASTLAASVTPSSVIPIRTITNGTMETLGNRVDFIALLLWAQLLRQMHHMDDARWMLEI